MEQLPKPERRKTEDAKMEAPQESAVTEASDSTSKA
jgi:hypothetical protein